MKFGEYDALVRPRALMICDTLRINDAAIAIIKAFLELGKTFAAMCHAPALLIEAGAVNGRNVTSYISISTDMIDAGGGGRSPGRGGSGDYYIASSKCSRCVQCQDC